MKEYIKKFETPAAADNYKIADIPFMTTAENTGQNLCCAVEGKKIKVINNVMTIDSAGPEMVDLGLSVLWAKTNIGAQTETDYGDYYQWAATTPLHVEGTTVNPPADWSLYPYTDDGETFEKYTGSDYDTIQSTDDIATVTYGSGYRMPTKEHFEELIAGTNNEWTTINGISGYKFTNKTDSSKYIFLPATGYCNGSERRFGTEGYYWSSSLYDGYPTNAWYLEFNNQKVCMDGYFSRYTGTTIRPVQEV